MNNPSVDITTRLRISALELEVRAGRMEPLKAMAQVLVDNPHLQFLDETNMETIKAHPLFGLTMLHAESIGWSPERGLK